MRGFRPRMKKAFTSVEIQGTSARKCVVGGGLGPLRSGEFVIGGELSGKDPQDRGKRVAPKVWWSRCIMDQRWNCWFEHVG